MALGLFVIVIPLPLVTMPAVPLTTADPVGNCAHAELENVTKVAVMAAASGCCAKVTCLDVLMIAQERGGCFMVESFKD
jgi:hypothetical protein